MTTDIPDRYIEEALRLTGALPNWDAAKVRRHKGYALGDAILAHAQTLMERDAERQELSDAVEDVLRIAGQVEISLGSAVLTRFHNRLDNFITPKPDPDEELAREVTNAVLREQGSAISFETMTLATIKALRTAGRITDAQ